MYNKTYKTNICLGIKTAHIRQTAVLNSSIGGLVPVDHAC